MFSVRGNKFVVLYKSGYKRPMAKFQLHDIQFRSLNYFHNQGLYNYKLLKKEYRVVRLRKTHIQLCSTLLIKWSKLFPTRRTLIMEQSHNHSPACLPIKPLRSHSDSHLQQLLYIHPLYHYHNHYHPLFPTFTSKYFLLVSRSPASASPCSGRFH